MTDNRTIFLDLRSSNHKVRDKTLELLYKEYFPVIKSYILENSGNANDAEDIFQDGMIVFYMKARNPEFELNCTIKTFIYSVCKNLWLNKLKVENRYSTLDDQLGFLTISDDTLDLAHAHERYETIRIQFEKMGEKCRTVLYNFYFHRMSMHSISKELGFANEQVAKNKKSRCLKKLKELVSMCKGQIEQQ